MKHKELIRNFAIIAHIDHGKSTLADRFIQITNGINARNMKDCVLDNLDLEREKGITIKARCIRLEYKHKNEVYILNLVDTPGHVDFQYEVEKAMSTIGIVILLIDATQGVASQTLSNYFLAIRNPYIKIIIAINKIDSLNADIDMCKKQIETILKLDLNIIPIFYISARTGEGVEKLLEAIIEINNYPDGQEEAPFKALIFDSWYDHYLGIVALIYVKDNKLTKKDILLTKSNNVRIEANKFGFLKEKMEETQELKTGEIGYLITNIKEAHMINIGDTLVLEKQIVDALPGFKPAKPVVFCSLYLHNQEIFQDAVKNLEKLHLNDSAFFFEKERSPILGMGFRCGFLGLLHMEIILERLIREYNLDFIVTVPNIIYRIKLRGAKEFTFINSAIDFPSFDKLESVEEPIALVTILTNENYLGSVKNLCFNKRGIFQDETYIDGKIILNFLIPLGEIILDFQDQLKSITSGYASYSHEILGYEKDEFCKLEFLVNGDKLDELSCIIHKSQALDVAKKRCKKLKDNLSRKQIEIKIQAARDNQIIASERLSAYRKDVIAHCSGGDRSRKDKLLKKQAAGKKNLEKKIYIPPDLFIKILKI
jgi:GTP-binding protein LepA